MSLLSIFEPVPFCELEGWQQDNDLASAFSAFWRCAAQSKLRSYRTGALGVRFQSFKHAYANALLSDGNITEAAARLFFETHFIACRLKLSDDQLPFVTGFYEPEIAASRQRTDRFSYPLYRQPDDLVEVDEQNPPVGVPDKFRFARKSGNKYSIYYDREAIDRGALAGQGLEICWVESRVDAFFIHVQGAARLKFCDGSVSRVTYAAKNGFPFTAIGKELVLMGEIPQTDVTMQSIRLWLAQNPERNDELLWKNRSYIFFRETDVGDLDLGPIAAAKVQLTARRSIAIDRLLHTFGTPIFVKVPELDVGENVPFNKLMIAQDTGSAIIGPTRGDLFMGTGYFAGEIAGVIRHRAEFHILLPRILLETETDESPSKAIDFRG